MQRKLIISLTGGPLLILLFFLSSCSRMPEQTRYIPGDAVMITGINAGSLIQKGAWKQLSGSEALKNLKASARPEQQQYLQNPEETGIDTRSVFYIFYQPDPRFGEGYIGMVAALSDANKFKTFLQKSIDNASIKEEGTTSTMLLDKRGMLAWNKETAILLIPSANQIGMNTMKQAMSSGGNLFTQLNNDSSAIRKMLSAGDTSFNVQDLHTEIQRLFSLSKNNSINSNDKFSLLQQEKSDLFVWVNLQQLYKTAPSNSPMLRADYFDKTYVACAVNFNNGSIDLDGKSYINKQLTDITQKYSGRTINMRYIKSIPSADITALFAGAFKPDYISAILNYYGLDGMVNLALSNQGLSLDTVLHAFSGDLLLAATDLKPASGNDSTPSFPDMNWLIAAGINNAATFDRLLQMADSTNLVKKQNGQYSLQTPGSTVTLVKNNQLFTVASSGDIANRYESGTGNAAIDPALLQHIQGQPFAFYLNINRIMQAVPENSMNSRDQQHFEMIKSLFRDMYITGGGVNGEATDFAAHLNFVNRDENSLLQLIRVGTTLYAERDSTAE